jgi:hypothetical protein
MIIDCDTCEVRGLACDDCVVSVLLGAPRPELDESERAALDVLAGSGLVPPLRLVPPVASDDPDGRRDRPGHGEAGAPPEAAAR